MESKQEYITIGALWIKRGKRGPYLSGYVEINGQRYPVTGFTNSFKESTADRKPDYALFTPSPVDHPESDPTAQTTENPF